MYIAPGTSAAAFAVAVKVPVYAPTGAISVTATNDANANQNTSEIGECIPLDTLFRDAFDE